MLDVVKDLLILLVGSSLVSNVVLSQFLGLCPFLGVSKKIKTASGMGAAVIFVITLASAVAGVMYKFVLVPLGIEYLQTIAFILVIASLVQLVEMAIMKLSPPLYSALGIYLPLITTNCAVLGVVLLNIDNGYNFGESIVSSLGAGFGFMVAMIMFAGVRERLEGADIPKSLQGLPITLVSASLVSMSFLGFTGLVENIFK